MNGPTPEPNVVGLVEIHLLFIRRVSGFGRVQVWLVRIGQIGGWIGYLHSPRPRISITKMYIYPKTYPYAVNAS